MLDLAPLLIDPVERGGVMLSRCPVSSHGKGRGDKNRSLRTRRGRNLWLVKCWAGCALAEICAAMGLKVSDLFDDAPLPRGSRPTPKPKRHDRVALAFQFDLHALDLRLRAERIREAGQNLTIATMTEADLDRALGFVAQAYADVERAEMFEDIAVTLRERDYTERMKHEHPRLIA